MKGAVNDTMRMRCVQRDGNLANARDQIVEGGGPEVPKGGFKRNASGFGCIPKRLCAIEPRVEQCPVFVHYIDSQ